MIHTLPSFTHIHRISCDGFAQLESMPGKSLAPPIGYTVCSSSINHNSFETGEGWSLCPLTTGREHLRSADSRSEEDQLCGHRRDSIW